MKATYVIPWYGRDIPGGAENLCRTTAEQLATRGLDVEVATTCLKSLTTGWEKDHHRPGITKEGGVTVRRFAIDPRDGDLFNRINARIMAGRILCPSEENQFMDNMVNSSGLYDYLAKATDRILLPLPYLFSTSIKAMTLAPKRTIPVPCLHDEGYAYLAMVRQAINACPAVIFNAKAEMALAADVLDFNPAKGHALGCGMDTASTGDATAFRSKFNLNDPFILYAGRRDPTKNTNLLIDYFCDYINKRNNGLKLVLIGNLDIEIPAQAADSIIDLGFVSLQDKADAMAAADIFCQPSVNESFSFVIMEAWLHNTPVLVHDRCNVTKEHAVTSGGGFSFVNTGEFVRSVDKLLDNPELAKNMAALGRDYVRQNFNWDVVCDRYMDILHRVDRRTTVALPRQRFVRQVVDSFSPDDPITDEAMEIGRGLAETGITSRIYSLRQEDYPQRHVRPISRLDEETRPGDTIIRHATDESLPWSSPQKDCSTIIRHHGLGFNAQSLAGIQPNKILTVCESANQRLDRTGNDKDMIWPPYFATQRQKNKITPNNLLVVSIDYADAMTRQAEAIRSFYFLKTIQPKVRLKVARFGGFIDDRELLGLETLIQSLGLDGVSIINNEDMETLLAEASVAICSGWGSGAVRSAAKMIDLNVPIIACSDPALRSFLGSASVETSFSKPWITAEMIGLILSDDELRREILQLQRNRIKELSSNQIGQDLINTLELAQNSSDRSKAD